MKFNLGTDGFNAVYSLILLSFLVIYPIFTYYLTSINKFKLEQNHISTKFSTLYEDLKIKSYWARNYYVFFMLRRMILSLTLVFLRDYPTV